MTNTNGGDRLERIKNAIERLINLAQTQQQTIGGLIEADRKLQQRQEQLAEQVRRTNEQIRTTSAGLAQLERTVDYLMRRDKEQNGGEEQ